MEVVNISHLTKNYGDIAVVSDVSFDVKQGEIFGLVGPNGAGKTTLIEILEGLRVPDSGQATVLGLDPTRQDSEPKERIGGAAPDNLYSTRHKSGRSP